MSKSKNTEGKILHRAAVQSAQQWMREIIELHEKVAADLRSYADRFNTVADEQRHGVQQMTTPVDALSFFVNATKTLPMNMRLDQAASHGAALALAAAKLAE